MLDIRWIRDNPQALDRALASRGETPAAERLIALDEARRAHTTRLQEAQARRNSASKEIGKAKSAGDEATAQALIAEVASLKDFLQTAEDKARELDKALADALAEIPNVPLGDVPVGADESFNEEKRRHGTPRELETAREHFELGEALGLMDFEAAARLSGARFTVLKGPLARLERALGQFMLDLHTTEHGYTEVWPPLLVRSHAMFGTGQLPKFDADLFQVIGEFRRIQEDFQSQRIRWQEQDKAYRLLDAFNSAIGESVKQARDRGIDVSWIAPELSELSRLFGEFKSDSERLNTRSAKAERELNELGRSGIGSNWLIPTAEVPLTNLVREQILAEDALPMRVTALTPCFRSEAGSAGRDTRGMLRQHQFDKVELVSVTTPEESRAEHERMTQCAEEVLKRLGLAYRTVVLSTGDMGFAAAKTYDIEVWLPGQGLYREISSCSVCGDFQARRMQARYRPKEGGPRFVHTLNGSGVAVGRALIAVMETYQNDDGSIEIPEALRPYMGGQTRIG
jgi:seryl-tRNA synthetase